MPPLCECEVIESFRFDVDPWLKLDDDSRDEPKLLQIDVPVDPLIVIALFELILLLLHVYCVSLDVSTIILQKKKMRKSQNLVCHLAKEKIACTLTMMVMMMISLAMVSMIMIFHWNATKNKN